MTTTERIRLLAGEQGISIAHICRKMGLKSRTYFTDIEKAKKEIPSDKLKVIAEILNVSVEYLMGETEDRSPIEYTPNLSEGEEALLTLFRQIPEDKQNLVLQMIEVALKTKQ